MDKNACSVNLGVDRMESLPLIQNLKASYRQRHEYAILATFNADLRFFEQRVLSNLRARKTLILMDEGQYRVLAQRTDMALSPRYAGVYYQVEPVAVPKGVFHSKLVLCLSEKRSRLVLGSGNLNRQGYMANAEIFSIIESENDQPDEATVLISEACDFLRDLTQGEFLSPNAKDFISKALALQPKIDLFPERQHFFVHSLHKPILGQIEAKLEKDQVAEIHVLAPFVQANTLIEELLTQCKNARINVYLQNNRTQFDAEDVGNLCSRYPQVRLFKVSAPSMERSSSSGESPERYIHAKLLGFTTKKSAYFLTGSPNFTQAALGLPSHDGNVETALFTVSKLADFQQLIKNRFLEIQSIDSVDKLTPETAGIWASKQSLAPLRILSARYDGSYLLIDFTYHNGEVSHLKCFEVICLTQGEEKRFSVSLPDASVGHIFVKCDLLVSSTVAWLQSEKISDGKTVVSERQWVQFLQSAEFSESAFNQDDFDHCVETGGIEGVRDALEIASLDDQPDWLIAFLLTWSLEEIFKANDPSREINPSGSLTGAVGTTLLNVKSENLTRGLGILVRPDMEEILEIILQKYRAKIFEWLGEDEAESVRMGLQYILVFDLLCLLLIRGFEKIIENEFEKKKSGKTYPDMQYGHVRQVAYNFIQYYQRDWEDLLEKGNLALYALAEKRLPPNVYLFHNARAALAYDLAKKAASQVNLEEPVQFKKVLTNLVGQYAKERCRSYLLFPDSVETLNGILRNFDLTLMDLKTDLDAEQFRKLVQGQI